MKALRPLLLSIVLWDTCQQCGGHGYVWWFGGWGVIPWCEHCDRCGGLGFAEPERLDDWED